MVRLAAGDGTLEAAQEEVGLGSCFRTFRSGGGGWLVDAAGLPRFGGVDEGGEEGAGQGAGGVGALGVPLDGHYEVVGRIDLDSFDDAVGGGYCGDAEVVADFMDGLVVAGVHGLRVLRIALRASRNLNGLRFVLSQVPKLGPFDCAQGRLWGTHGCAQ